MAGPGRIMGLFPPAPKFSGGPGRKSGIFLPVLRFSAGQGGGMDGFFGGREFCWERGRFLLGGRGLLGEWCFAGRGTRTVGGGGVFFWGGKGRVPLFQKLEFRELFAEVGAVGEGDGVDAEGLGGGDVGGVVVDKYAVGGLQ